MLKRYRLGVVGAIIGLLMAFALPVYAASITESDYWERLASTASLLSEALQHSDRAGRQPGLDQIVQLWTGVDMVHLDGGRDIHVDMSWVLLPAKDPTNTKNLRTLQQQIANLLAFHAQGRSTQIDTAKALDTLDQLLSDSGSQGGSETLGSGSRDSGGGTGSSSGSGGSTTTSPQPAQPPPSINLPAGLGELVLVGIALAIVVLVLVFLARGLQLRRAQILPAEQMVDDPTTSEGAKERAAESEGTRDYREAIRYLYLACLIRLDERGLLRYDRTLTNREYLRVVSNNPDLLDELRPIVYTFDRAWYGFVSIDENGYEEFREHVEALDRLTPPPTEQVRT